MVKVLSAVVLPVLMTLGALSVAWSAEPAADEDEGGPTELGTFVFQFENDTFTGTDQHYTNGIRLSWTSPDEPRNAVVGAARKALRTVARDEDKQDRRNLTRYGAAFGQDMYTPEDKDRTDLIVEDRPYAGWLYGAFSMHTITERGKGRKDLESVELQLGVVGPWALAEESQDLIHEIRLLDKFKGWRNQLENEPGLLLLYERKWRLFERIDLGWVQFDAIPHAGVSLGNVLTHANVGGAARLGWDLPDDFGPPSLIQGVMPMDTLREKAISFYLFGSMEGRLVAHNIFLDGNTFRDSHSVDKNHWVGDVALGASVHIGRLQISYSNAVRSREFEGQPHDSRFGSITIACQI